MDPAPSSESLLLWIPLLLFLCAAHLVYACQRPCVYIPSSSKSWLHWLPGMWLIFCIRSTSHTVSVHNGCPEIYTGGHFSTCFRLCRDISLHEALPGGLFKNSQLCNTAKNCPVGELGLWGNCYYFCCKILFPFQDTLVEPCSPWFPPMKLLNSTPWLPRELCCFLEAQSSNSLLPLPPTPTPRQFSGSPATYGRRGLPRGGATFLWHNGFLVHI